LRSLYLSSRRALPSSDPVSPTSSYQSGLLTEIKISIEQSARRIKPFAQLIPPIPNLPATL